MVPNGGSGAFGGQQESKTRASGAAWQCPACYAVNAVGRGVCHRCHRPKLMGSVSAQRVRVATWKCPACHLRNPRAAERCSGCSTYRDGDVHTASTGNSGAVWQCRCQLLNPGRFNVCRGCGALRPGTFASADGWEPTMAHSASATGVADLVRAASPRSVGEPRLQTTLYSGDGAGTGGGSSHSFGEHVSLLGGRPQRLQPIAAPQHTLPVATPIIKPQRPQSAAAHRSVSPRAERALRGQGNGSGSVLPSTLAHGTPTPGSAAPVTTVGAGGDNSAVDWATAGLTGVGARANVVAPAFPPLGECCRASAAVAAPPQPVCLVSSSRRGRSFSASASRWQAPRSHHNVESERKGACGQCLRRLRRVPRD